MNPNSLSSPGRRLCALLILLAGARAFGQTAPAPRPATAGPAAPKPEETVQLNAFEVRADVDNSYGRKGLPWLGEKYSWSTQLNVRNALNHYRVWVVPTSALGTTLNARYSAQPRSLVWTNSVNF